MNPYLLFNGDCESAMKFYEKSLGGKVETILTHEATPMEKMVPRSGARKSFMRASSLETKCSWLRIARRNIM